MAQRFAYDAERERLSEARAKALEALLIEKGIITSSTVDKVIGFFETEMGPFNGAKVVARAWVDPEFKERLLADANAAIESSASRCSARACPMFPIVALGLSGFELTLMAMPLVRGRPNDNPDNPRGRIRNTPAHPARGRGRDHVRMAARLDTRHHGSDPAGLAVRGRPGKAPGTRLPGTRWTNR